MGQDIQCSTTAAVSPGTAFDRISDIAGWWATNVSGPASDKGDRFCVRFGKTYCILEVIESIPDERIVWKVIECCLPLFNNPYEWNNTELIWDISSDGQLTTVRFMHKGIVPGKDCYADCTNGWKFYITQSLHQLIINGKGFPGSGIFARVTAGSNKYEGLLYFKNDPVPVYGAGHFYIDVKETVGEEVTAAHAIHPFNMAVFDPSVLKGEYYMVIADDFSCAEGLESLISQ